MVRVGCRFAAITRCCRCLLFVAFRHCGRFGTPFRAWNATITPSLPFLVVAERLPVVVITSFVRRSAHLFLPGVLIDCSSRCRSPVTRWLRAARYRLRNVVIRCCLRSRCCVLDFRWVIFIGRVALLLHALFAFCGCGCSIPLRHHVGRYCYLCFACCALIAVRVVVTLIARVVAVL